jgi:hypothetical protein
MKKSINRFLTPTLTILIVASALHFYVRRHVTARAAGNMDAAQSRLERTVPALRFENVPLEVVLRRIASASGVTLRIDWESLARESLRRDTRTTALVTSMKLGWVLEQALVAAAPRTDSFRPGFEVCDDGSVRVASTRDLLARGVETRRYDIRDLAITPRNSKGEVYGFEIRQQLAEMLAARTWCPEPDAFGDVRYEDGWLVVTHTRAGHRAFERVLAQFRREFAAQAARILNAEYTTPWE